MRKLVAAAVAAALAAALVAASVSEQTADAGSRKKIHFTQTIESSQDPGGPGQLALVLPPSAGTLYDGSVTYSASAPAQLLVLHEGGGGGVPSWSADGKNRYAVSLFAPAGSGSLEFTGAALALRADSEFAATVSVDAWTRGQPAEILVHEPEEPETPPYPLARATVEVDLPLHRGMHEGGEVLYVITDGSDAEYAEDLSEAQGWRVEHARELAGAPEGALQDLYVFTNGIEGGGLYGFQDDLFSEVPGGGSYSALSAVTEVEWKRGQRAVAFESAADVEAAGEAGRVTLEETGVVLNAPHVAWPGGQMQVRQESNMTAPAPYEGGQVARVDAGAMTVTFVAHRGWGPDGRTTYCIITDAAPSRPAETMGVVASPTSALLAGHPASSDLFQFKNGIRGAGALGFQPYIAEAAPGDRGYTPMRSVHIAEWADPGSAAILETLGDVEEFRARGELAAGIARPTLSHHVLNCPGVDPFQR